MTHTHSYATLVVPKSTLDTIVEALRKAGPEYVERYVEEKDGATLIHMPDVALTDK
jgi:hypothetical protein